MTSMESIGSCSLDLEASEMSDHIGAKYVTASEFTLQSSQLVASVNGTHAAEEQSSDNVISKVSNGHLTNGHHEETKRECTIAEIKLPSYVSISCAISGYANYSKFCRSRDNSPARPAFRKSSLESNTDHSPYSKEQSSDKLSPGDVRCSRSHSDCNGNARSIFTESRQVTVSKQLQIPLKSCRKYTTEIVINNGQVSEQDSTHANGCHTAEEFALAKEVGNGAKKSLVQQRIESLYGSSAQDKVKLPCRTSRSSENQICKVNGTMSSFRRSPSCPPQVIKSHLDNSLPVFKHLTKDFREQLLLDDAISSRKMHVKKQTTKVQPHQQESREKESVIATNGFHSLPNGVGADECDRQIPAELSTVKSVLPEDKESNIYSPEKDGHMFLSIMDAEKQEILGHIHKWEGELKHTVPDDASGKIRAACGKANLLLSQKFEQFRGLCIKNIEEDVDTPFYTTSSDLAGFWDMVMLQVKDVKMTFSEIEEMKENNWQEVAHKKPTVIPHTKVRKSGAGAVSKSNPCTPKRSAKAVEMAKSREEARRQLMAAKKKARQQNANVDDVDISIYTPHTTS